MKKNPAILKVMDLVAKAAGGPGIDALKEGRCPMCGEDATVFRDELSRQEFDISGMCQTCQDKVFVSSKDEGEDF